MSHVKNEQFDIGGGHCNYRIRKGKARDMEKLSLDNTTGRPAKMANRLRRRRLANTGDNGLRPDGVAYGRAMEKLFAKASSCQQIKLLAGNAKAVCELSEIICCLSGMPAPTVVPFQPQACRPVIDAIQEVLRPEAQSSSA
jgi:hypothetical protein